MLIAGDIGGTKTRLAIVSAERGPRAPLAEKTFRSADYQRLEDLLEEFFAGSGLHAERACLGVAGPVLDGKARVTNLPWAISANNLQDKLGIERVELINDLVATAYAVPRLEVSDLETLNQGCADISGAIAVLAPGTGLGEAYITRDGKRYLAHASEGGHADFAPTSELQIDLLHYLQSRIEHVSYEWICSGMGLPNIYAFLKDSGRHTEPGWLAKELAAADDKTPLIITAAIDEKRPCELCATALDLFCAVLGAEAGNLALKMLATGGVYLGGGIPPHILSRLKGGGFMEAFRRKGRFKGLLAGIPVQVILNPKAALLGAAWFGLDGAQSSD